MDHSRQTDHAVSCRPGKIAADQCHALPAENSRPVPCTTGPALQVNPGSPPTVKGQNSFNHGTESTGPEGCGDYAATDTGQTCRLIMPWTDDLPTGQSVCPPLTFCFTAPALIQMILAPGKAISVIRHCRKSPCCDENPARIKLTAARRSPNQGA